MRAVKESKRLVALLAVLFLMSGVFSVIAAASPEDADLSDPVQGITEAENTDTAAVMRIQVPRIKKVLQEKQKSELISAKAETADQAAAQTDVIVEEAAVSPEGTGVPAETFEAAAEAEAAGYEDEPASAAPEYIPEDAAAEPEYIPEEIVSEPEYIPEETPAEPEYVPEETPSEPEYVPEAVPAEPEYIPEQTYTEPEYVPEQVPAEPEYVPEAAEETDAAAGEGTEAVQDQPVIEAEPEPTPEPAPEAAPEANLTFLGNFMLTAYCPCSACCGAYATGYTASGTLATEGRTIAMGGLDFGTKVSINGHIYTVEDRGTAYGHVDIFFADHSSALAFGLQYADVYLVE